MRLTTCLVFWESFWCNLYSAFLCITMHLQLVSTMTVYSARPQILSSDRMIYLSSTRQSGYPIYPPSLSGNSPAVLIAHRLSHFFLNESFHLLMPFTAPHILTPSLCNVQNITSLESLQKSKPQVSFYCPLFSPSPPHSLMPTLISPPLQHSRAYDHPSKLCTFEVASHLILRTLTSLHKVFYYVKHLQPPTVCQPPVLKATPISPCSQPHLTLIAPFVHCLAVCSYCPPFSPLAAPLRLFSSHRCPYTLAFTSRLTTFPPLRTLHEMVHYPAELWLLSTFLHILLRLFLVHSLRLLSLTPWKSARQFLFFFSHMLFGENTLVTCHKTHTAFCMFLMLSRFYRWTAAGRFQR